MNCDARSTSSGTAGRKSEGQNGLCGLFSEQVSMFLVEFKREDMIAGGTGRQTITPHIGVNGVQFGLLRVPFLGLLG